MKIEQSVIRGWPRNPDGLYYLRPGKIHPGGKEFLFGELNKLKERDHTNATIETIKHHINIINEFCEEIFSTGGILTTREFTPEIPNNMGENLAEKLNQYGVISDAVNCFSKNHGLKLPGINNNTNVVMIKPHSLSSLGYVTPKGPQTEAQFFYRDRSINPFLYHPTSENNNVRCERSTIPFAYVLEALTYRYNDLKGTTNNSKVSIPPRLVASYVLQGLCESHGLGRIDNLPTSEPQR